MRTLGRIQRFGFHVLTSDATFRFMHRTRVSKKCYSLYVYYNEPVMTWRGTFRSFDQSQNTWERVSRRRKVWESVTIAASVEVQLHGTCANIFRSREDFDDLFAIYRDGLIQFVGSLILSGQYVLLACEKNKVLFIVVTMMQELLNNFKSFLQFPRRTNNYSLKEPVCLPVSPSY